MSYQETDAYLRRDGYDVEVVLTLDLEGAKYLQWVLYGEWLRTSDLGAKDISDELQSVINENEDYLASLDEHPEDY